MSELIRAMFIIRVDGGLSETVPDLAASQSTKRGYRLKASTVVISLAQSRSFRMRFGVYFKMKYSLALLITRLKEGE